MLKIYLDLAESFEKLASNYRALARESDQSEPAKPKPVAIEDIRAVLAEKSKDGKTAEIKTLLMKYDAGKLSGVKPEDYAALLADAEGL